MPLVRFTANIQRHVSCESREVQGATVREALQNYFNDTPKARAYVLADQGGLRPHMAIFVNGAPIRDRDSLSDTLNPQDTMDVMQALSGG